MPRKRCVAAARRGAPADAGRWQAGAAGPQPRPPAPQVVKLKAFSKFDNTAEALQAAASLVDSKMSKSEPSPACAAEGGGGLPAGPWAPCRAGAGPHGPLKLEPIAAGRRRPLPRRSAALPSASACPALPPGLKKFLKKHAEGETLAVVDAKLGGLIKEKLGIPCVYSAGVLELSRGVRNQLAGLVAGLAGSDLRPMALGLSHSLSRYKLKFSPDKVDTMIVQ